MNSTPCSIHMPYSRGPFRCVMREASGGRAMLTLAENWQPRLRTQVYQGMSGECEAWSSRNCEPALDQTNDVDKGKA